MNDITDEVIGKTLDISSIRARGFAMAKALICELAELDERIGFVTEGTIDDRNNLLESARRLTLLLDGSAVSQ